MNQHPAHLSRYETSHSGQLSLAIPSWVGALSTSQRGVTSCSWEVKAGMIRVWVVGKTVWSHCYPRAISERFRDKGLIMKRYINSSVYFTLFTHLATPMLKMNSVLAWSFQRRAFRC